MRQKFPTHRDTDRRRVPITFWCINSETRTMYVMQKETEIKTRNALSNKEKSMKILIIDDSEIIYNRLYKLTDRINDKQRDKISVITNFENLLMDIYQTTPDVIIINTYSLRGTLFETIRAIKTIRPQIKIISLTEFSDKTFENLLKDAGSDYFIDIASGIDRVSELIGSFKSQSD